MTPANLTKFGLDKNILVLGKNYDKNGLEYISIFESRWVDLPVDQLVTGLIKEIH